MAPKAPTAAAARTRETMVRRTDSERKFIIAITKGTYRREGLRRISSTSIDFEHPGHEKFGLFALCPLD